MANQQPELLADGTSRNQGRTAQRMNILAAKLVAETVRTTLGPQGMDKMIVDALGDVIITNDGATILKEMNNNIELKYICKALFKQESTNTAIRAQRLLYFQVL